MTTFNTKLQLADVDDGNGDDDDLNTYIKTHNDQHVRVSPVILLTFLFISRVH